MKRATILKKFQTLFDASYTPKYKVCWFEQVNTSVYYIIECLGQIFTRKDMTYLRGPEILQQVLLQVAV